MKTTTLVSTAASFAVITIAQWSVVDAGFFVCPSPCEAMLLPRDMESLEDCLCHGQASSLVDTNKADTSGAVFRCPFGSMATRLHPLSFADCACAAGYTRDDMRKICTSKQFQCIGRYRLKKGVTKATSLADCDCQSPYKKDESSGVCVLKHCPRAGNYVKKFKKQPVNSLADCACVDPFTKNDQSGECVVSRPFKCPANSQPIGNRHPTSFDDCYCDWGFVRTQQDACERESVAYACPNHSMKRTGLSIHERPRSFDDCECEDLREFRRNDMTHQCERRNKDVDGDGRDEIEEGEQGTYTCPPYARPLSPIPHSVEQCECLPGYGWKTPEMSCVALSAYTCPPHAFKPDDSLQAERLFSDCECARGYYRDDTHGACLEWFLANDNGCPDYAYLRHWPLQSKANCQCIYGLATSDPAETPAPEKEGLEGDEQLRQSKTSHSIRKKSAQCNPPPTFFNVGPRYTGFSQCPDNAVAISWPIATPDDCMCKDGFEILPLSDSQLRNGDGEGFQCVDPMATITSEDEQQLASEMIPETIVCRPPLIKNVFTGECRLPVEQVRPRNGNPRGLHGSIVFKGVEYNYVLTEDDIMVIQGDVAIGEIKRWPAVDGKPEITTPVLHGYYNADRDHRWEDATMCYEIGASATAFTKTVENAMNHITSVTNFTFQKCRNNACAQDSRCNHDYVTVTSTPSSCFSYIGRIGGRQTLGVSADCGLGNIVHILLHAVGLRHTIDRPDRDDHVRVAWECVPETRRSFFLVEDVNITTTTLDTPYDFFSIMHHPPDAFVSVTAPWCQSVFPLIAEPLERIEVISKMGQRELLAVTDIHEVWRLYPSLQADDKPPTYISAQEEGDRPAIFESRLHTEDDVDNTDPSQGVLAKRKGGRSWGHKLASFVGALVTLMGFGAVIVFAIVEFRRRATLQGTYYSESLLSDKTMYD